MSDWTPAKELLVWASEHLSKIPVDGIWSPDDSGVQYRKMDEDTFALMFMYNHPAAEEMHKKFTVLMKECGMKVLVPDDVQRVTPPIGPQAQAEAEFMRKQEIAMGWSCECGEPLANSDLSNRTDEFVEVIQANTSNNQTIPIELWLINITCHACEKNIPLEVDDYHILAGDDLFMSCSTAKGTYKAITRHQVMNMVDTGDIGDDLLDTSIANEEQPVVVLGTMRDNEKVPPWMWGCMTIRNFLPLEEE